MNPLTPTPIVRARGLTKIFNHRIAVDGIDFDIWPGEIVGFLGPNGAGKTTTIRMLLNILKPNSGHLSIFGLSYIDSRKEILKNINASSGTHTLLGKISVTENLKVFADLYALADPKKRIQELLEKFDLNELQHRPLFTLSTGQQVRVTLAKAFINHPQFLLLDEPTSSLDPDVAHRVRDFIKKAVMDEGTTVFFTSHNMAEVEKLCTRVLFINQGKIEAEGTPKELAERVNRWTIKINTRKPLKNLPKLSLPSHAQMFIDKKNLMIELDRAKVGPLITDLVKGGVIIDNISIHEPSLEDFFVEKAKLNPDEESAF